MTERLDALMVRAYQAGGETKNAYTKVGVAFPLDGGGYRLKLDALPVPTIYEGKVECSMLLVPPRERDSQPTPSQSPSRASTPPKFDDGDGVPF